MYTILSKLMIILGLFSFYASLGHAQSEQLEIAGAIQLGYARPLLPDPGTIRWVGVDFEGWNGDYWISLTGSIYIYDVNHNRYEVVLIGDQIWMTENLRATHFNDSIPIDLITSNSSWSTQTTPAYTWYDNTKSDYGALYNHYVVSSTHNVCPVGWRVPSVADWTILSDFLGGSSTAGGKIRQSGLEHWASPNFRGTNDSGFNGLPGGFRRDDGSFFDITIGGYWWTSTFSEAGLPASRFTINAATTLFPDESHSEKTGLAIRCIKN